MSKITQATPYSHPVWYGKPQWSRLWFDTIEECVDWSEHNTSESKNKHRKISSRDSGHSPSMDWDLGVGWGGARRLAETGWQEGAQKVDDLLDKVDEVIRRKLPLQKQSMRLHVVGGKVSVPSYLAGHPKQFVTIKRVPATCKTIRLVYCGSTSGGVEADTMVKRGVAVCAIVRALERRRVRCEVIAAYRQEFERFGQSRGWPGDGALECAVVVKRAEEKLAPDRVAYVLAHPGFYRRIFFATMEAAANMIGGSCTPGSGYGMPTTCPLPDSYIIPTIPTYNDAEMQAFVEAQIEEISKAVA